MLPDNTLTEPELRRMLCWAGTPGPLGPFQRRLNQAELFHMAADTFHEGERKWPWKSHSTPLPHCFGIIPLQINGMEDGVVHWAPLL